MTHRKHTTITATVTITQYAPHPLRVRDLARLRRTPPLSSEQTASRHTFHFLRPWSTINQHAYGALRPERASSVPAAACSLRHKQSQRGRPKLVSVGGVPAAWWERDRGALADRSESGAGRSEQEGKEATAMNPGQVRPQPGVRPDRVS